MGEVVTKRGCLSQYAKLQRPIAKEYVPPYCGHTLFSDIFYPVDQKHPYLLITCGLSRYCVAKPMIRITPLAIIDKILVWWFAYYGRCRFLITDRGPGYVGSQWHMFCETWGVTHTMVSTMASHSNGMVESRWI